MYTISYPASYALSLLAVGWLQLDGPNVNIQTTLVEPNTQWAMTTYWMGPEDSVRFSLSSWWHPSPYHPYKSHQNGLMSCTYKRIELISPGVAVPVGFTGSLTGQPSLATQTETCLLAKVQGRLEYYTVNRGDRGVETRWMSMSSNPS